MNKKNKANQTAQLSLLIATMVVIEVLSQTIFAAFVLPIKPTLTHIPVIIASLFGWLHGNYEYYSKHCYLYG